MVACADGVITRADRTPLAAPASGWPYGIQVRIEHRASDGLFESIYAHLASITDGLFIGAEVRRGQQIGLSDSTGNSTGDHLHFSLKKRGNTAAGIKQQLGDGTWALYPSDIINPTPLFENAPEKEET